MIGRLIFAAMGVTLFDGAYVGGLFAILGHLYPVYFGFRGGKGILTSIGIIAVINPLVFVGLLIIGLPLIFLTKIVSVGSLAGAVCYPILTLLVDSFQGGISWLDFSFSVVIALLVIWMHRANIKRLLNGTENRFGGKKQIARGKSSNGENRDIGLWFWYRVGGNGRCLRPPGDAVVAVSAGTGGNSAG